MKLFLLTMYVSGGLIPTFLVMNSLGLYNTRTMMLLSGGFSVYNCIICRSFFDGLPKELEEAAEIDGCSPLGIFTKIVLPLSKALLGVMVLYYAVGRWNSYFTAMIYLVDDDKKPLALVLRRILQNAQDLSLDDELGAQASQLEALIRYSSTKIVQFL